MFIDYMAYKVSQVLMGFTYIISCVENQPYLPTRPPCLVKLILKDHFIDSLYKLSLSDPLCRKGSEDKHGSLQSSAKVTQILK